MKDEESDKLQVITEEGLAKLFGKDQAKAAKVFNEISALGGFGVRSGYGHTLALATASDDIQAQVMELIETRASEEPEAPVRNETPVAKPLEKGEGQRQASPKKSGQKGRKRKAR
jgi:hypothetical protein